MVSLEVYGRYVRHHLKSELAVDQLHPIEELQSQHISCEKQAIHMRYQNVNNLAQ
jgi:hypothetical protein